MIRYASRSLGIVTLWICVLPLGASAPVICALGPGAASYKPDADGRPTPDAMELAGRVNSAVTSICAPNCPGTGLFRNPTAPSLMLQVNSGVAKLVYAPQFFSAAYEQYGDGAIVGLIAHEMGHALDDALGAAWIKSSWTPELRADAWAGCALGKLGQSAKDLEGSLAALAKYPSAGHPAWSIRLPALQAGFTQCGGDAGKFGAALPHTR